MQQGNVIEVSHVSKSFKIYLDKGHTIKEKVVSKKRRKFEKREVLEDISFSVKQGEAIGLIGSNGCGKSTTLKLLTRILYPDSGTIEMKGRVSSLLELGAGFHPDMSGRENIYINASIFGLSRKEIDARLDDIIAFSELEEFIDNPVRTYSSGMYMRLAFSVAINVDADILLIDEILAVGDVNFQAKCFTRLREIKAQGTTIVIVSHSTGQIEQICDRAIWINKGRVCAEGKATMVIDRYMAFMSEKQIEALQNEDRRRIEKEETVSASISAEEGNQVAVDQPDMQKQLEIPDEADTQGRSDIQNQSELSDQPEKADEGENQSEQVNEENKEMTLYEQAMDYSVKHFGLGTALVTHAFLMNADRKKTYVLEADKKFYIEIGYQICEPMDEVVLGMGFYTLDGTWIFGTNTLLGKRKVKCTEATGKVIYVGEELPLLTGKYIMQVSVTDVNGTPLDFYRDYCHFDVISSRRDSGVVYLKNSWEIDE